MDGDLVDVGVEVRGMVDAGFSDALKKLLLSLLEFLRDLVDILPGGQGRRVGRG